MVQNKLHCHTFLPFNTINSLSNQFTIPIIRIKKSNLLAVTCKCSYHHGKQAISQTPNQTTTTKTTTTITTTACSLRSTASFDRKLHNSRSLMADVLFIILLTTLSSHTLCSSQSDTDTLMQLKQSFTSDELTNWVPGPDSSPCLEKWVGVLCRGEAIVGLHLSGYNLTGTVDVEALLQLPELRSISLNNNSFEGPIPEFNKLGSLKAVYLTHNQFTGEIPKDYFSSMRSLKKIWLDENEFTGEIPESLMELPQLLELHLEGNQFSGEIPELKSPNLLKSFNVSDNKLEGEIPESISKFGADSFDGNIGLCGKPLKIGCAKDPLFLVNPPEVPPTASSPSDEYKNRIQKIESYSRGKAMLAATTIVIVLCFVIASVISTRQGNTKMEDDPGAPKYVKSGRHTALPVYVPPESVAMSVTAGSKNGLADLVMVNAEKGAFGLQDLMNSAAEMLGGGVLGSAYKAVMANGLAVVVKRMKEMNRLEKEEFDVEMRRFGLANHPNVLMPLAYHYRKEEKLIVSEYMPKGSLLYVLHGTRDVVHANLNWPTRLKIIKGIVRGLGFIHAEFSTNEVPHGNLKSSNILLTQNYDPLLSDYAFQPLTSTNIAAQALFAYKSPEYLKYQRISPKSDIYCLGIVILEIMTGKFPSQYLNNVEGGVDIVQWVKISISKNQGEELIDPEIVNNAGSINQMVQVLKIGAACAESNPRKRLDINEVMTRIGEVS